MNISIEPISKNDIDSVVEIEKQSFPNPWARSQFETYLEGDSGNFLVAKVGKEVAGYVVFEYVLDEGHISNLAVKEDFRGKGIAKNLVKIIINKAKNLKLNTVWLEVRESNHTAKHIYSAFGFVEVNRRKQYYEKPIEDALVLRLDIK